jgi:hypothetical protein
MQQTKTTLHLGRAGGWLDQIQIPPALIVVAAIFIAAAGITAIGRLRSVQQVAPAPTPGLIILIATAPAVAVPTAVPAQQAAYQQLPAERYVTAFAAPDNGIVLGPIPWDANSPILGRWGDSMIMTAWQGNNVWVRVSELGGSLANLAPAPATPQPQVIYQVVNQPAQAAQEAPAAAQPAYQVDTVPQAAPAATPVPIAPITDVQREWAAEQWREEHCIAEVCR